jgi:hemerythrin
MDKKLEEITWSPEWEVNISAIDQSHKEFVSLLNRVVHTINQGACPGSMSELFFSLIHYAENHFIREEILLRDAHYPLLDKHQEKHAAFIEKIHLLQDRFSSGNTDVCLELYHFLQEWFHEHILQYDQHTVTYLKQQGLS